MAAPTNLPQLACHARAQPTYGFAAQGVQTVTESCDAATSNVSITGLPLLGPWRNSHILSPPSRIVRTLWTRVGYLRRSCTQ